MAAPHLLHRWDLDPQEAIQLQRELATKVIREGQPEEVKIIAGIDISANDRTGLARAAIVALAYPSMDTDGTIFFSCSTSGFPAFKPRQVSTNSKLGSPGERQTRTSTPNQYSACRF